VKTKPDFVSPYENNSSNIVTSNTSQENNIYTHAHPHLHTPLPQIINTANLVTNYNHTATMQPPIDSIPTLIIKPFLYLGGIQGYSSLRTIGITHILNVASEIQWDTLVLSQLNIQLKHVLADDRDMYNIGLHFEESFRFIEDALNSGGKVFVHCAAGISRSPTVVIAYIMRRYNMPYPLALDYVKRLRPIVNPNNGFKRTLTQFDQELAFYRSHQARPIKRNRSSANIPSEMMTKSSNQFLNLPEQVQVKIVDPYKKSASRGFIPLSVPTYNAVHNYNTMQQGVTNENQLFYTKYNSPTAVNAVKAVNTPARAPMYEPMHDIQNTVWNNYRQRSPSSGRKKFEQELIEKISNANINVNAVNATVRANNRATNSYKVFDLNNFAPVNPVPNRSNSTARKVKPYFHTLSSASRSMFNNLSTYQVVA